MTNQPYQLMPPLTAEERQALKDDIREKGVLVAVEKDDHGNILDGHHRMELVAELRAEGVRVPDPVVNLRLGLSEEEKEDLVLSLNLDRRHLTREQRKEWHVRLRQRGLSLREIAEKTGASRGTVANDIEGVQSWTPEVTGRDGKTYPSTRPAVIAKNAREERDAMTALADIPEGVLPDRAVSSWSVVQVAERHRARASNQQYAATLDDGDPGLIVGDFREKGDVVLDDSVDLIFTDPPYNEDAVVLYGELSRFAARVLRPGGLCLAYAGTFPLNKAMSLMGNHLDYFWTFAITHSGGASLMRKLNLRNYWKPILAFAKAPVAPWWETVPDCLSGGKEKAVHPWQQAIAEAEHFIRHLCPEGGLVCDPFAGGGTSLVAAANLGRHYVGFEINPATAAKARERLRDLEQCSA